MKFELKFITDDKQMVTDFLLEPMDVMHSVNRSEVDTFLSHFGKKGMRWGVRNVRNDKSGMTRFKDKAKHLTDQELAERIKRLETEKKYNELNSKYVGVGRKNVNEVLTKVGQKSAIRLGSNAAIYATRKVIEKKFGTDLANTLTA